VNAERTKITLNWRPAGAPAQRLDDFEEVGGEVTQRQERRQRIEVVPERCSIGRRLENWGAWANMDDRGGRGGNDCMTGVICESMRRHAVGELHPAAPVNDRIDVPDAERINRGITKIDEAHRWVLHWTYVVCAKPWGVAGACGFSTREYPTRLANAQRAIEIVASKS
jgi:hypothetical protein